jgi:hypothetical protein
MTGDAEAMHDYLAALELRLKSEAVHAGAGRTRTLARRRPAIAVAIVFAVVLPAVLVVGSLGGQAPRAYGKPAILQTAPVAVPAALKGHLAFNLAAGPRSTPLEARPIPAFGGTAYLLSGKDAWCLSAPDPAAGEPDIERGVTCTRTSEFLKLGISLLVGNHYIAAIPQGVDDPTLRHADGSTETLHPDEQGVVVVDPLSAGDTVSLHGTDGHTRIDRAHEP